jgi:tRNA threonylcarbamoyladenosine biosynthesis protein TsaB
MILALKTADHTASIYVIRDTTQPPAATEWESGRQLSDQLLGRIIDALKSHKATPEDLTGIVIFSGPGSFTSLRIGHTTANALADSLKIPIIGVTGEDWLERGLEQIKTAQSGTLALPHYGAEAHITRPKS